MRHIECEECGLFLRPPDEPFVVRWGSMKREYCSTICVAEAFRKWSEGSSAVFPDRIFKASWRETVHPKQP